MSAGFQWRYVVYATSALSVAGGLTVLLLVPDGPFRKAGQRLKIGAFLAGFRKGPFRSAALGYFGHMWELYSFWAFVPLMLAANKAHYGRTAMNVPLLSSVIIAAGGLACVASGLLSGRFGARRLATLALALSGLCCLLSPLVLLHSSATLLIAFLLFWGLMVIADSPLFSALVAKHAIPEWRGSSLTMINCLGFSITIVSIETISALSAHVDAQYIYMLLAIGPALGLIALLRGKEAA
jgi:MFS family permease